MTIKEAAKKLHVEAHVLRYWEDELKLDIKRNAQGHRIMMIAISGCLRA